MALMDDMSFLITHIRNSYITSDDTGVCEMVIDNENEDEKKTEKRPKSWHVTSNSLESGGDSMDNDLPSSPDIVMDMDYGNHRRRSNTAQRLERLKKEKQSKSKIKHIPWKNSDRPASELGQFFEKKEVLTDKAKASSLLSWKLKQYISQPLNPFSDYAKFDGKMQSGIPIKHIGIFLTMTSPAERSYPMTITVVSSAKIRDVIGLICWQYSVEGRQPKLCEDIGMYSLHMVEDDGEVDMDFPALDTREPISKFGFSRLALVQKSSATKSVKEFVLVTVNFPASGFSRFQVESKNVLLKDIIETALHRRKVKKKGLQYIIEKQSEPGVPLDPGMTLNAAECLEFCLVRENSARGNTVEPEHSSSVADSLSSHQYKCYQVYLLSKLRTTIEVQLGISGEKIEIDPVAQKGTAKIFSRQKPVTLDTETVATCDVTDEKPTGKSLFRIVYGAGPGHDYRHYDLEVDTATAREIVQKVNNILEMRSSAVRKEYLAIRNKKMSRRFSSFT